MALSFALPAAAQLGFLRLLQGQAPQADVGDDMFLRRYAQQGFEGQPLALANANEDEFLARMAQGGQPRNQPAMAQQQIMPNTAIAEPVGPAQRGRVNPLNVIGRVLAPKTFGAIDSERTRLQAEADAPARQARIARALGQIRDPREQALFLGLGSEDWQKNIGQQFAPQVVAEGAAQRIAGSGDVYNNRRTREFGDSLVRDTDNGYETLGTRGPTIAEQNAQGRLAWDREYGGQRLGIDEYQAQTGRMNAETTQANSGFNLSQGQTRYDPNGNPIASVAPAPSAAAGEIRQAVAGLQANNDRFRNILTTINGDPTQGVAPAFELSPANALRYDFALATGSDDPAAAAYGNYKSEIEAAVADALRLNVGPQTDQDAIREARALLSNINNKAYVSTRLPTVIANNERLARARQAGMPQQQGGGSGPIAQDAQGNRVQWNGSAWVPL